MGNVSDAASAIGGDLQRHGKHDGAGSSKLDLHQRGELWWPQMDGNGLLPDRSSQYINAEEE